MVDAAARYCTFLETLTAERLDRLGDVVAPNVHFKDPFNDVTGIEHMRAVFEDMFKNVEAIAFKVHECTGTAQATYIFWTLSGRLRSKPWSVDGVSRLAFGEDGLLVEHIDFWDAAAGLYEHFPAIGWVLRQLRRRLQTRCDG